MIQPRPFLLAIAAAFASPAAFAAGSVDLRILGGETEIEDSVDSIETEDTGFDFRSHFEISPRAFLRGRYTSSESDDVEVNGVEVSGVDLELDILRGGIGLQGGDSVRYYGALEYVKADLEVTIDGESGSEDEKGIGLFVGLGDKGDTAFLWNVELGYLELSDSDGAGFEFNVGYRFNPTWAVVLGGQGYSLEDELDLEYTISHGTLGVRASF